MATRIAPLIVLSVAVFSGTQSTFAAGVLPQGGRYVAGFGTIASQGDILIIAQPGSTRGVIDWSSFSIGNGNTVTFANGFGATLNRVTGGSVSTILGTLNATGDVYLINPQGVLIGRSGVISTGGRFVASSLDLPDGVFMHGGTLTLSGTTSGKVVNLGKISSDRGDVFLISHDVVENAGSVSAPNGTAEYVAGQQVVLYESSGSRQVFVQIASHGNVIDRGTTEAAQINLEAADGNIYALAGSGSRIRATGTATRDGHIWLVADNGNVTQQGTLTATNADGTGGTVDTLANTLRLPSDAAVHAGLWNVSTPNLTVDAAAAGAFTHSLNVGTSVVATATGTNGASGDLNVASNLDWTGPASLALVAFHDVAIAPATTLNNTGTGNLSLRADAANIDNAGSVTNHGTIDWSGSNGIVSAFYDMNGSYSPGTIFTNGAWVAAPYSGLMTQATSYKLVNSLTDLRDVSLDLAGNYAVGKDIDAGATSDGSYLPIGNSATPFTGQFDGLGHTVGSLSLQPWIPPAGTPGVPLIGMFGDIGDKGAVRDLNVDGTVVGAPYFPPAGPVAEIAMLASISSGMVVRVHASGSINSGTNSSAVEYTVAGGLLGINEGTVARSSSSVSLVTGSAVGGLVGVNNGGLIVQSFSTGPVQSLSYTNEGAGGLAGVNEGTISQSYSTSPTLLRGYCRGAASTPCGGAGLAVLNYGTINESFATGAVTQPFYQPIGIARTNTGVIGNDVYWDKDTTQAALGIVYGIPIPAANGLTTAQMSTPSSFPSYDFSSTGVWAMPAGATHPFLRWQVSGP
jgi:filamentous hemagglutinin family protein